MKLLTVVGARPQFVKASVVSKAIAFYRDQATARAMGRRGRDAVPYRNTWEGERDKLVSLYRLILGH